MAHPESMKMGGPAHLDFSGLQWHSTGIFKAVRSMGRTSEGADTDSNCTDFRQQTPTPGVPNRGTP
jgi:hypothetical protein